MIRADNLSWSYGSTQVLEAASLATRPGRVLGLIGPNGSGKTTLLRLLYGALESRTGTTEIDGTELSRLKPRELALRLAVVVQEAGGENSMTVAETVMLGRTPHLPSFARVGAKDRAIVEESLEYVGATHLASRRYVELSGGERQRVLIARALAQRASHLLLDEPTNHLDIRYQHDVLGLVAGLARDLSTTTVVVLHDLNLAARYCDDLVLLGEDTGTLTAGTVADVLLPEILEPVYGIGIERMDREDGIHLLYRPHEVPSGQSSMGETA